MIHLVLFYEVNQFIGLMECDENNFLREVHNDCNKYNIDIKGLKLRKICPFVTLLSFRFSKITEF